ncbi:MAG TPA: CpsD/CapB family tyrosine-protein kinase [Pyrinomonadaceae bacterium]|jgi:capsular exopolysaccharide synthesis family protein
MRFFKTLQKSRTEETVKKGVAEETNPKGVKKRRRANKSPEDLIISEMKFGKPAAAVSTAIDSLPDTVPAVSEAEPASALSKIISVEVAPSLVNPRIVALTQPNSAYCEEYRSLRTQILHKSQRQKMRSIVIASVLPGEGKSITALNLSWLLAQTDGINALIIDCDLRRPCLTDYLGITTGAGLSDVLDGKSRPLQTIVRIEPAGLYLLPGGQPRSDVAEILSGPRFGAVLDELHDFFDYIIIDAPPLGIFTDATVLINQTDAALLVVRANHSNYKTAERIMERLPRERMLGAVLNYSDDLIAGDSHYYDYYYQQNS